MKRPGKVSWMGGTLGLYLKRELLNCGLDKGSEVTISVVVDKNSKSKIVIEAKDKIESSQPNHE